MRHGVGNVPRVGRYWLCRQRVGRRSVNGDDAMQWRYLCHVRRILLSLVGTPQFCIARYRQSTSVSVRPAVRPSVSLALSCWNWSMGLTSTIGLPAFKTQVIGYFLNIWRHSLCVHNAVASGIFSVQNGDKLRFRVRVRVRVSCPVYLWMPIADVRPMRQF